MTKAFLDKHPDAIFVFGDNLDRVGYGGAASLRDNPQTHGFITKKHPDNIDSSFYRPDKHYEDIFFEELLILKKYIQINEDKTIYISQLGGGLANRYKIWETFIKKNLELFLGEYDNVVFMWD